MESIRLLIIFVVITISSCNPICLERQDVLYYLDVPYSIVPHKDNYTLGDTLRLSLLLNEYYSNTTEEYLPINENLLLDLNFTFYDTMGYMRDYQKIGTVDSFELILDTNAIIHHSSQGSSAVILMANAQREVNKISSKVSIIPKSKGLYALHIYRIVISEDQFYAEVKKDCGNEKYDLDISINKNEDNGQNTHLIQNDTSLYHKFGHLHQNTPMEEMLERENIFYFSVE